MIRYLHILAICGLIASAGYAYSVKYEALYYAEQVAKLRAKMQKERDATAVIKAEWHLLNRPDRLQTAAERHLDLQPLDVQQMARLSDLPNRAPRGDEIARKIEALGGLDAMTTATVGPRESRSADGRASATRTSTR